MTSQVGLAYPIFKAHVIQTSQNWFTKQITKFVKRKFQGSFVKFYEVPDWNFEVSIQGFIFNFEVSDQSFEVRGEARLNRFDCKHIRKYHICLEIYEVIQLIP